MGINIVGSSVITGEENLEQSNKTPTNQTKNTKPTKSPQNVPELVLQAF